VSRAALLPLLPASTGLRAHGIASASDFARNGCDFVLTGPHVMQVKLSNSRSGRLGCGSMVETLIGLKHRGHVDLTGNSTALSLLRRRIADWFISERGRNKQITDLSGTGRLQD
jgi:hypothetical protein